MMNFSLGRIVPFRRSLLLSAVCLLTANGLTGNAAMAATEKEVEQWGVFEMELHGPAEGNPFVDVSLSAEFSLLEQPDARRINVPGFYDGDGTYRLRFMPDRQGVWQYTTREQPYAARRPARQL